MGHNSFGKCFTITTWGESHGKAMGVVVDGCPAGLEITAVEINEELRKRRPGMHNCTSPRKESDEVEILSGVYEGKTTGTPISLLIPNRDADSSAYDAMKEVLRPGHAQFTYLQKYGIFDHRGGGRASARETVCRVAAGAIAKKLLRTQGVSIVSYLKSVGSIAVQAEMPLAKLEHNVRSSALFCPDAEMERQVVALVEQCRSEGDSVGGIIETIANPPPGWGEPIYEKMEALLASAMLSLPAAKGFEIGAGFLAAHMRGSEHNDAFALDAQGTIVTTTNRAGGTLGGITTGMPLQFSVAFKPTSSIRKPQKSVALNKELALFVLAENARHDPCVALRAPPIVEAMTALVLADAYLMHK